MSSKSILALLCSATILLVAFTYINRPTLRVVMSWQQSESISYHSFDPYFFNVVEDNIDYGHIPFSITRNYFIYIGKENTEVTYGHVKNYSFNDNMDITEYLKKCNVFWSLDGVEFTEPDGHKLFFPKKAFIGGR